MTKSLSDLNGSPFLTRNVLQDLGAWGVCDLDFVRAQEAANVLGDIRNCIKGRYLVRIEPPCFGNKV